ncbi:MAG: toprim domain-containing protein [Bacteroidales bacterium]|nr:toprim domain-containing protein [Bacteroidales bacterium]
MMNTQIRILDEKALDEVRRFSQPDLIRMLFPGHPVKDRGVMPSPLRDDRNASFSCFISSGGIWKGKDFSTGEVYDNISLYRTVFPHYDFIEAVDSLSWLVLKRSALVEYGAGLDRSSHSLPQRRTTRRPEAERPSALQVVSVTRLDDASVPSELVSYWRDRAISDANIMSYCVFARFESTSLKGRRMLDPVSGLPLLDSRGNEMMDDGIREAVGFYNDIGGMVFRVPQTSLRKGFKGANTSYISTLLADGTRPAYGVVLQGAGDNVMHFSRYDKSSFSILINPTQRFYGVSPKAAYYAAPLLDEWHGRVLDERDVKRLCAVLTSLNSPVCGKAAVVEGMFDGLSFIEMQGMSGRGFRPGVELVVLNSITNLKWAVPFLAMEDEVRIIFDNDLKSGAGRKAFNELRDRIQEYSSRCRKRTLVTSGDYLLGACNDLNDALVADKAQKKKSL